MPLNLKHVPDSIAKPLRAFYRRKRLLGLLRVVASGAAVYGCLVLAATHVDRFVFLNSEQRFAMLFGTHVLTGVCLLIGLLFWLIKRPTARGVAYEMESRLGGRAEEQFVTVEDVLRRRSELAGGSASGELIGQLQASATALSDSVRGARLVRNRAAAAAVFAAIMSTVDDL